MILVGDIGGTNPRLAAIENGEIIRIYHIPYPTNSIIPHINDFLKQLSKEGFMTNTASFCAAGPHIDQDRIQLSQKHLNIDINEIKNNTALENVTLHNDFSAIVASILHTQIQHEVLIQKNPKNDVLAVIGAGTGLGAGFAKGNTIVATEFGGTCFSETTLIPELVTFIQNKKDITQIPIETICSGRGITLLAQFLRLHPHIVQRLKLTLPDIPNTPTQEIELPTQLSAKLISEYASKNTICWLTMRLFMYYSGVAAQNLALTTVCLKGLYLAGGIFPKNKDFLTQGDFLRGFYNNSKQSSRDILHHIPIYLITDYNCSLYGCEKLK